MFIMCVQPFSIYTQCISIGDKNELSLQDIPIPVEEKPTKQEYAVATYLKKSCPTKKTKFLNHQVNYFYGKLLHHEV